MNERKGSLYLFTGLLIGLGLGLAYSLFIHPVVYTSAAPHALDRKSKDQFMALVALAYDENMDIGRASSRLALLREENQARHLAALAQQKLAMGGSPEQARALARLSVDLGGSLAPLEEKTKPTKPTSVADDGKTPHPTETVEITPTK